MRSPEEWEALKEVDITKVVKEDLVDICEIEIDTSAPVAQRLTDFIAQVGNPYCFRVGDTPVKLVFDEEGRTFEEILIDYIKGQERIEPWE